MAKVTMRRLRNNDGMRKGVNLMDIASELAEEYEVIQPTLDSWEPISPERMAEKLEQIFTVADLGYLSFSHSGKGIMIGAVIAMCAIEDSIQDQMEARFPGGDIDDDPTDDELEEVVANGVFNFGFGEGNAGDEEQ